MTASIRDRGSYTRGLQRKLVVPLDNNRLSEPEVKNKTCASLSLSESDEPHINTRSYCVADVRRQNNNGSVRVAFCTSVCVMLPEHDLKRRPSSKFFAFKQNVLHGVPALQLSIVKKKRNLARWIRNASRDSKVNNTASTGFLCAGTFSQCTTSMTNLKNRFQGSTYVRTLYTLYALGTSHVRQSAFSLFI